MGFLFRGCGREGKSVRRWRGALRCREILKFVGIPAMFILYVIIAVACHPLRIVSTALSHVLLRL